MYTTYNLIHISLLYSSSVVQLLVVTVPYEDIKTLQQKKISKHTSSHTSSNNPHCYQVKSFTKLTLFYGLEI